MICKIDDNGYCDRHKEIHDGQSKYLCLLDTEDGEKYRKLLDDRPSSIKKIVSLIGATLKQVSSGNPVLSDEQYKERLKICETCIFFKNWKCESCGCYLTVKAKWATQDCPENKWPKINEVKNCGCSKKT